MKNKNNILKGLKSTDLGFKIPENYFENFERGFSNSGIKKSNGFTVPDQYFEKISDEILAKIDVTQIPEQTGFTTPNNYFKNLEIKSINKTSNTKVINLFSNQYKRFISLAIAASFLLFIGVKYFGNKQETIRFDDLTAYEIENWMDESLIGFNAYEIAEVYEDIDISNSTTYFEDEIFDYLEEKDLELLFLEN